MAGRKRKLEPTVHGWRLHWFIEQVKREEGLSEAEIARRAGVNQTYINAYARIKETGVSGVSLDVAQKICDAWGMDGSYWLAPYKGEQAYQKYVHRDLKKSGLEKVRSEQSLSDANRVTAESNERIARLLERVIEELRSRR